MEVIRLLGRTSIFFVVNDIIWSLHFQEILVQSTRSNTMTDPHNPRKLLLHVMPLIFYASFLQKNFL